MLVTSSREDFVRFYCNYNHQAHFMCISELICCISLLIPSPTPLLADVFPLLLQCSWVCLAWSLNENVIYVFEPSMPLPVERSRVQAIERACFIFKLAMHTLRGSVFNGYTHSVKLAPICMLALHDVRIPR